MKLESFLEDNYLGAAYYSAFFVTFPVFSGYATLFALQKEVKDAMGVPSDNSSRSQLFTTAASMLYLGNLFFRLGHNFVFGFCSPRYRVIIAIAAMCCSMLILMLVLFVLKTNTPMVLIFFAYGLGGMCIGSYESNILATVSKLGSRTVFFAIVAMPVGISFITVGAFTVLALSDLVEQQPGLIHFCVFCMCLIGIAIYVKCLFYTCSTRREESENAFSIPKFLGAFQYWRVWLWGIKWNCVALMFDMFCVSAFSPGVILYVYDCPTVRWFGGSLETYWFNVIYNVCILIGDSTSRRIGYAIKMLNPFLFLILSIIGVAIVFTEIPEIAPLGGLCISFANGCIYSQSSLKIKKTIPEQFTLIALSSWLFLGDLGSVAGSNLINLIATGMNGIYGRCDS